MRYSNGFGIKGSKILLGTAYFGDTISVEDSFRIMDTYVGLGGTHIDTARLYADGESERVIASWFKSRRPEGVHISTKGAFPSSKFPEIPRLSEADVRYDLELSLRALEAERIDFYWLHRDDESRPVSEIVDYMNKFVKEGKIARFGASNWKHERIEAANKYAGDNGLLGFEATQIRFSPAIISPNGNADRKLVDINPESFGYYAAKGMPVAAYASQAKGFFSKMAELGEVGLSKKSKERYLCEENLHRLAIIKELSAKYGCSIAAVVCGALCSLSSPEVFAIIGGSKVSQIEDSMKGADIIFEKDELRSIFGGYTIN